ncbi:TMEM175 family protein [Sphingobacterium detergens]|uniref:Putative membrane protein n=1 Tax=Sphingobacterium detergens TaxID=1145106 RepID=A0A420BLF2_SPHD1|nr:TMEM175 family protein [Sphingobacterium detergens]RKE57604.1 putative membrane protein [Sphingobacterium detergens]
MTKSRLEAFSDGVLAIIITIMVLELKVPEGYTFANLKPLYPKIISYIVSFIYVGLYWNNHHHLFQIVRKVNGKVLWGNLHLLFWLSLMPVTTNWIGESHFERDPIIAYGVVLIMCSISYNIVEYFVIQIEGEESALKRAVKSKTKENISTALYFLGIGISFINPYISLMMYGTVAIMWLIPDRRIETLMKDQ